MLKQRTWVAVAAVVVGFQLLGLGGLAWFQFFASWDFTSDPCNFAGVYCDSDKVLALNLGDPRAGSPGLTGHLILQLGSSLLSSSSPCYIGQLRVLQTLDLSYNQLTGGIPRSIGTLPALSNVILCHNRLSGTVPPLLSQTLTRLDLKHNDLSGSISPSSLPPSLQYLSLSWNRLSGTVDRALTRMNRLNYLDLSMNRFSGCIPGRVFTFPITNLQLQRNSFTGRSNRHLKSQSRPLISASTGSPAKSHPYLNGPEPLPQQQPVHWPRPCYSSGPVTSCEHTNTVSTAQLSDRNRDQSNGFNSSKLLTLSPV
ncbi:LRR receptor-like serine/threonine-protein kinase EFR [Vitis vinifera]|uniref:LRR receptor-like serine/threonine-protein kinase EFR n=1 Tax=Vitis vinifera TaxID=29760 RepID=A0A438KI59_VITVI|nr:LRR receptor-like serine/threonine-protein kinase EFR [Vitis vinifera]